MMLRANAAAEAVKNLGQPRVVKRGKTPELLLTEKGVYFYCSFALRSQLIWRACVPERGSGKIIAVVPISTWLVPERQGVISPRSRRANPAGPKKGTMKIPSTLFFAVTAFLHGAPALAARDNTTVVRMPYFERDQLEATDGSLIEANLGISPKVVNGVAVVAQPWPNLIDLKRYAQTGPGSTEWSAFHFKVGPTGRQVERIDVGEGRVLRLRYDAAGNVLEIVDSKPDGERGIKVALSCYTYNGRHQLTGYDSHDAGPADCGKRKASGLSQRFAYDAHGALERAIVGDVVVGDTFQFGVATRVTVYDAAGAVLAHIENNSGQAVSLPESMTGERAERRYGTVSEHGELNLRGRVPQSHRDWYLVRVAKGDEEKVTDPTIKKTVFASGTGHVHLSAAQQAVLASEIRTYPGRLFLTFGVDATPLLQSLTPAQWAACINVDQQSDQPCGVARRTDPARAAAAAGQRATTGTAAAAWSTQTGFADTAYAAEFAVWQDAFTKDISAAIEALTPSGVKNSALVEYALDDKDPVPGSDTALLAPLFARSIADTPKGRSFKRLMIRGYARILRGRPVPLASVFVRQVLGNPYLKPGGSTTRAVGYGGMGADGAFSNEVLYIMPAGLNNLRPGAQEPGANTLYAVGAWARLALPPFGKFERDVWPTLLFTRAPDRRLLMYGMSREMHTYCTRLGERLAVQSFWQ